MARIWRNDYPWNIQDQTLSAFQNYTRSPKANNFFFLYPISMVVSFGGMFWCEHPTRGGLINISPHCNITWPEWEFWICNYNLLTGNNLRFRTSNVSNEIGENFMKQCYEGTRRNRENRRERERNRRICECAKEKENEYPNIWGNITKYFTKKVEKPKD